MLPDRTAMLPAPASGAGDGDRLGVPFVLEALTAPAAPQAPDPVFAPPDDDDGEGPAPPNDGKASVDLRSMDEGVVDFFTVGTASGP